MSAEKKSLRKEYIRRRDGISSSLAMIYANAIRARLWNVAEFTEAHAVSGYHSTGSEVYTGDILRDVLARGTSFVMMARISIMPIQNCAQNADANTFRGHLNLFACREYI